MTVRDKSGRKRYVAVRFRPSPRGRNEAARVIESCIGGALYGAAGVKLIDVQDGVALIRCRHIRMADVVRALNCSHGGFSLETLGASGTLKGLRSMI